MDIFEEVMKCLWPARLKYNEIGIAVSIDAASLEEIKLEHPKTLDCFMEVIKRWLRKRKPVPCWVLLAEALSSLPVEVKKEMKVKIFWIIYFN